MAVNETLPTANINQINTAANSSPGRRVRRANTESLAADKANNPARYVQVGDNERADPAAEYEERGWRRKLENVQNSHRERQDAVLRAGQGVPEQGMLDLRVGSTNETVDDYHTMLRPYQPFHEATPERQAAVRSHFRQHGIETFEDGVAHFGAQLDQAFHRSDEHGENVLPYASAFYHEDHQNSARRLIGTTATDHGVPYHVAALAHAITSANGAFDSIRTDHTTGEKYTLPDNDDSARFVLHHALAGTPTEDVARMSAERRDRRGFVAQTGEVHARAVHAVREALRGTAIRDLSGNPLGDKTGMYYNSLMDPSHPYSRTVVDRHVARAIAPHQLQRIAPQGEDQRAASRGARNTGSRQPARALQNASSDHLINVVGAHSYVDSMITEAARRRGLGHIDTSLIQAAAWGEARLTSPSNNRPSVEEAYGPMTGQGLGNFVPDPKKARNAEAARTKTYEEKGRVYTPTPSYEGTPVHPAAPEPRSSSVSQQFTQAGFNF